MHQRKFATFALLALGLSGSSTSTAQSPLLPEAAGKESPLSLQDCRQKVGNNNLSLRRLKQQISSAEADLASSKAGYLPILHGGIALETTPSGVHTPNNRQISLQFSLPIFEGFKTRYSLERSQAELKRSNADFSQGELSSLYQLESTYHQLYFEQQRSLLLEGISKRLRQQLLLMKLKYQSGLEAQWAVTKAEADLGDATLDLRQSTEIRRSLSEQLSLLMGEENNQREIQTISDFTANPLKTVPSDLGEVLADHPELQSLHQQVESSHAAIRVARADYWPKVAVNSTFQRPFGSAPEEQGTWSIGISADFPLINPSTTPAVHKASAIRVIAQLSEEERRLSLLLELKAALASYEISLAAFTAAQFRLRAAQQREFTIDQEYTAGLRTFVEWEQAQQQLIQAEKTTLSAQQNAALALDLLTFKSARKLL